MLLKPEISNAAREVLREAGVLAPSSSKTSKILSDRGLAVEDLADDLASIIRCADEETTRLRAIELGMKLHGELDGRKDSKGDVSIKFEIHSENVNLNSLFAPQR